jgi:hypothetical protein
MVMAFAAGSAPRGLTQFVSWPVVGRHDVRQFMKTGLLAFTDTHPVFRADLYQVLPGISVTAPAAAPDNDGFGAGGEGGPEPFGLLDGVEIGRAVPVANRIALPPERRQSQLADRKAGRQLRVICRFLKFGRLFPRSPVRSLTRDRRLRQYPIRSKTSRSNHDIVDL